MITREAHGEITVAHRLQGAQQLALIESRFLRRYAAIRAAAGALSLLRLHQRVSLKTVCAQCLVPAASMGRRGGNKGGAIAGPGAD
jgi:hypothetical protein